MCRSTGWSQHEREAGMNEKMAWYVSRSSGWVAFVLLAVTVVWGILGITKIIQRRGLPRWMMDLHKYLALLTIVFTGIHLAGLVADNYTHIAWAEILIPYAFDWKPGSVTFGIVAMYLLVAVQVSSWLRPRLPRKLWKSVHMLSYPSLWLVAMHGLNAGTDSPNLAVRIGVMVVIGLTSFFTLLRILMGRTARRLPVFAISPQTLSMLTAPPQGQPVWVHLPGQSPVAAPTGPPSGPIPGPIPGHHLAPEVQHDVDHVLEAVDVLQAALERMQAAGAEQPSERRAQTRTLVDDVPPRS
jgi:predicted ferric reductase